MIELLDVSYINGERTPIDYAYKKSSFTNVEELENYRKYLEKKLEKQLFFSYKSKTEQEAKE